MRSSVVICVTLVISLGGCVGRREAARVPAPPVVPAPLTAFERRAVGCYQLVIGPWYTLDGLPSGGAGDLTTPPAAVELDSLPSPQFPRGSLLRSMRPALGAPASIHRFLVWFERPRQALRPFDDDLVVMAFSTGFGGLRVDAAVYPDSLVGRATELMEFPDPGQTARAIGYRVPCHPEPAPAR